MALLQYGDYKPDLSDYEASTSRTITNVLPQGDGYGPVKDFTTLSQALPGLCRGGFYAVKSDGSIVVFAGTSTDLYLMSNTDYSWSKVSKGGVSYSGLTATANWQFAQFGNFVLATQANAPLQLYDLTSSTAFADCLGSPPQAAYIAIVGRFTVLSGLLSFPYRIQWSGLNSINAANSWTSGINSSDFQDFSDGGVIRGVAGGEYGTIFQDQAIRRMIYSPGSAVIFQISRMTQDQGLFTPYSLVQSGPDIFFYSARGFYKVSPGTLPVQIGRERVDRTFFMDLDKSSPQLMIGASDPRTSRVYWAYKSTSGQVAKYDKIIGYDKVLDKWFTFNMKGQYILGLSQPNITLEGLDAIFPNIDLMPGSLDSYASQVLPELSQFNDSNVLGFFRGANLEATLDTGEQGWDADRIYVNGFKPVTDAPTVYGSITYRETPGVAVTYTPEVLINSRTGRCDLRKSTRYARMQIRIPAGTAWSYTSGVEPDIRQNGKT